ncbi:hypothetical protein D3C85_1360650 [compost metagenome]
MAFGKHSCQFCLARLNELPLVLAFLDGDPAVKGESTFDECQTYADGAGIVVFGFGDKVFPADFCEKLLLYDGLSALIVGLHGHERWFHRAFPLEGQGNFRWSALVTSGAALPRRCSGRTSLISPTT